MRVSLFVAFAGSSIGRHHTDHSRLAEIEAMGTLPTALDDTILVTALADAPNKAIVASFLNFVHEMNKTFDYKSMSEILSARVVPASIHSSFAEDAESGGSFEPASSNPHCDVEYGGPKTVQTVVPAPRYADNPFNKMPSISFDLTKMTTDSLNRASGPQAMQQSSAGLVTMVGMMMVKNMVQSAVATATAIIPPAIPPPVWNLRPLPCMPMVTGGNCFGAVTYPITFADTTMADTTDSTLTGLKRKFRGMFRVRAGIQPDAVYQQCFKAFMSLQCSDLFPMCTNPQGQDEMIPFIGRVPTCFTACMAVLMMCPGFTMADIQGPCSQTSFPPLCTQAFYRRDDLGEDAIIESEIDGKFNSKCTNYDPQVDAGQDPLLYEVEPPLPLFSNNTEVQMMLA